MFPYPIATRGGVISLLKHGRSLVFPVWKSLRGISSTARPVSTKEFAQWMTEAHVPREAHLLVAASGGADSMALCLLARHYSQCPLVSVVTIDHALRKESCAEAEQVKMWLNARQGFSHTTMRIQWPEGCRARTEVSWRTARHQLLIEWARASYTEFSEAPILLLGHHNDDQVETLIQRIAQGAGVSALRCMRPVTYHSSVRFVRPLLNATKERLQATCRAFQQPWMEDPSNSDETISYRNRVRSGLSRLTREDIHALSLVVDFMAQESDALAASVRKFLSSGAVILNEIYGIVYIERATLMAQDDWFVRHVLFYIVAWVTGRKNAPRRQSETQLVRSLRDDTQRARLSSHVMGGCRIWSPNIQMLALGREGWKVKQVAVPQTGVVEWDTRYVIHILSKHGSVPSNLIVRKLRAVDVQELESKGRTQTGKGRVLRRAVGHGVDGLPVVVERHANREEIIAVPHLNVCRDGFSCHASFLRGRDDLLRNVS